MNCFNGEKFLKEAIESVITQDYQNWEIIFWDNQSTDLSASIIQSYSDQRIKYFYSSKHTKLYEARALAIEKASGDFFAFLDTDDFWHTSKLSSQVPLFSNEKVGLVYSNYTILDELNNTKYLSRNKLYRGDIQKALLQNYFIGLVTLMVRREAYYSLPEKFDPNLQIIGDLDFTFRISKKWQGEYSKSNLAYCRKHGSNLLMVEQESNINELKYLENKLLGKQAINHKYLRYLSSQRNYLTMQAYLKRKQLKLALIHLLKIRVWNLFFKGLIQFLLPQNFLRSIINARNS